MFEWIWLILALILIFIMWRVCGGMQVTHKPWRAPNGFDWLNADIYYVGEVEFADDARILFSIRTESGDWTHCVHKCDDVCIMRNGKVASDIDNASSIYYHKDRLVKSVWIAKDDSTMRQDFIQVCIRQGAVAEDV